ncbi:MAG TPA: hypothetical protein VF407_01805, partial [Polyangiaceae bacterium]
SSDDAGSGSSDDGGGGANGDAGQGGGGGSDSGPSTSGAPSSITVTGSFGTPTCTSSTTTIGLEYDCSLAITGVNVSPPLPSGTSLSDGLYINDENRTPPDMGWTDTLVTSKPAYPSACFQYLTGFSSSDHLLFAMSPHTSTGASCGYSGTPSADDYSNGFKATGSVTWEPTGDVIPFTIDLSYVP